MRDRKKPEILAPAGSMESLKAAIAAGCDAVYIGGSRFGARAYADNPQGEEMIDAIRYCHLYGVKLYLTVNTILKEKELEEELYHYIRPYYQEGLDAAIVQDVGVMRYLHHQFPKLTLHASTQMTLTMGKSARLIESYGVTRIVPARELTLRELALFRQDTGLEMEVFVHGALCYCYSGQCLFSSMQGGRSGNRGRCAQPCRMPYSIKSTSPSDVQTGRKEYIHILSLKENCNLAHVGELIEAGVDSFKIEGRMKRPEYTAFTTAMYRKYVDLYDELGREDYETYLRVNGKKWQEDMRKLGELYNRNGFTSGYLEGHTGDMLSSLRPKHGGIRIGRVQAVDRHTVTYVLERDLHPQDVVEIRDSRQRQIYEYTLGEEKKAGQTITAHYQKGCRILRGNPVYRTRDARLMEEIQESYIHREKKLCVQAVFLGKENEKMVLELVCQRGDGQIVRIGTEGEVCQKAQKQPATEEKVKKLLCQTGNTPFVIDSIQIRMEGELFLPVGAVKQLRRQALEKLQWELEQAEGRECPPELENVSRLPESESGNCLSRKGCRDQQTTQGEKGIMRIASVLTWEQFKTVVSSAQVDSIYLKMEQMTDRQLQEAVREGDHAGKKMYLVLPAILREMVYETEKKKIVDEDNLYRMEQLQGFIVRNMESFVFLRDEAGIDTERLITDSNLYVANREAIAYWRSQGCRQLTLPLELTGKEMGDLIAGLREWQYDDVTLQAVVYGHIPLMISAQCVRQNIQGCGKAVGSVRFQEEEQVEREAFLTIQDMRGREFYICNTCKYCYNVIYQGEPFVLGQHHVGETYDDTLLSSQEGRMLLKHGVRQFRYDFSVETPEEVGGILAGKIPKGHTGHFYHGIE